MPSSLTIEASDQLVQRMCSVGMGAPGDLRRPGRAVHGVRPRPVPRPSPPNALTLPPLPVPLTTAALLPQTVHYPRESAVPVRPGV